MAEHTLLDTRAIDKFLDQRASLIKRYQDLDAEYDKIIQSLKQEWKGRGADAFFEDAKNVKSNITGIKEVLNSMCDLLKNCRDIYGETDTSLGKANRDVDAK